MSANIFYFYICNTKSTWLDLAPCLQLITTSPVNHFLLPLAHLLFLSPPESQVSSLKFECDRIALLIRQKSGSMWARKLYNVVGAVYMYADLKKTARAVDEKRRLIYLFIALSASHSRGVKVVKYFKLVPHSKSFRVCFCPLFPLIYCLSPAAG